MFDLRCQNKQLGVMSDSIAEENGKKFQGILKVRIEGVIFASNATSNNCNVDNKEKSRST